MIGTAIGSAAASAVFAGAMIQSGLSDLRTMRISNRLIVVLVGAYLVAAPLRGLPVQTMQHSALVAGLVLAIGFVFFALGWIGGGDAKLAAATTLWLGGALIPLYLVLVALFGGLLTATLLFFRAFNLPPHWRKRSWLVRLHAKKSGVPYGIALAAAGLTTFAQTLP